jgi:ABC-type Na+ efflux pump permease subunit
VARREFASTVATRGFLIGVLFTPILLGIVIFMTPRLMNEESPRIEGEVAILDPTSEVLPGVRAHLAPERLAERRAEEAREAAEKASQATGGLARMGARGTEQALAAALGEVPRLHIAELPGGADVEREKDPLKGPFKPGGRIAVIVVHPDAVVRAAGKTDFGTYDLYVRGKLDDRVEDEIRAALRDAIVDARIRGQGLDRAAIEALTHVGRVRSRTVTAEGERTTNEVLNAVLPAGFMILLLMSVMTSGQYLMTTTVEEKSSRVVEVLLSAVSPRELMTGKILGQMGVGLLILALYAGLGIWTMFSFAVAGLVDLALFAYLVLFFLIAYTVMASTMAAIGSSVNEMREAQALMTPVTLVLMIPWVLWMPISRNPNSAFSTALSFIPPINTFATLLRMTSSTPPPLWQVWASIAIGVATAAGALWFAAKVFRIGLLMYGKPPNFATLVRWARMA